jgi:ribonuclease HI
MIRTKIVELSTIEAAAYRQKLMGGKSEVVVMRYDTAQPGLATFSRNTGDPVPNANVNLDLYPLDVFKEALELTHGLPYAKRGAVKLSGQPPETETETEADATEDEATVDSAEYAAVVEAYTNKKGELSYDLINKDFIQFAHSSKLVGELLTNRVAEDHIRNHIVKVKLEQVTGNRDLTEAQAQRIVDMLDEVSPRYVFRELNDEIRRMLSQSKG